jgi:hypothetical protein
MSRKVNLGNYESADAFMSVGGITHETTEADVIALLDGPVKETFEILKARLRAQVARMRNEGGQ